VHTLSRGGFTDAESVWCLRSGPPQVVVLILRGLLTRPGGFTDATRSKTESSRGVYRRIK